MCTFQVNILLCKSASTHLAYNCVLNHYWELSNEVLYQILSQGISELQEVRDESYKNAYVFYWSNFESQKVFLILLEIKLYAIPHLKALTSDWHIYGRLGCCCTFKNYLKKSTYKKQIKSFKPMNVQACECNSIINVEIIFLYSQVIMWM